MDGRYLQFLRWSFFGQVKNNVTEEKKVKIVTLEESITFELTVLKEK